MTLPYWAKLDALPTTNARIVLTLCLIVLVVLTWTVVYVVLGRATEPGGLDSILFFLAALAGIDTAQFFMKRRTQLVTPPTVMASDAEAPSTAMASEPARVAPRVPADLSRALGARQPVSATSLTQALPINATAPPLRKDD